MDNFTKALKYSQELKRGIDSLTPDQWEEILKNIENHNAVFKSLKAKQP